MAGGARRRLATAAARACPALPRLLQLQGWCGLEVAARRGRVATGTGAGPARGSPHPAGL
eukprot:scaffold109408_cov72-Phaeocystis_antarctica.AAC.10